jgi:hypothetical protein
MSSSLTTSAATCDVIHDAEPGSVTDGMSHAPVLVTEREVLFSASASASPRPASSSQKLSDAIRVVVAGMRLPAARRHYPRRSDYLELSRMAREMERL